MTDEKRATLDAELKQLIQGVEDAVKQRTIWMDAHMPDYAIVQVGEELYDGSFRLRGVVTKLYRFHENRDWRYDTSMYVNYEYVDRWGNLDNTSRQTAFFPNSKADVDAHERAKYQTLKRKFEPEANSEMP